MKIKNPTVVASYIATGIRITLIRKCSQVSEVAHVQKPVEVPCQLTIYTYIYADTDTTWITVAGLGEELQGYSTLPS